MPNFSKFSKNEIEKIIKINTGNLALEGMICTQEEIESMRRLLRGETTEEAEIAKIIIDAKEIANKNNSE